MLRWLLLVALLSPLAAQDYELAAEAGVECAGATGGLLVAPPYTPVRVTIRRHDTRAFSGRLVVNLVNYHGKSPFGDDNESIELVEEVSLADGDIEADVVFDMPVGTSLLNGFINLERQAQGGVWETLSSVQFSAGVRNSVRSVVGFISNARLSAAQPWLFYEMVEIAPGRLPESWKSLACFDAIVLNSDQLNERQSRAIMDYVAAGGTLVISPNAAAALNADKPAGKLLGIPATGNTVQKLLKDFPALMAEPVRSGISRAGAESVPGGMTPPGGSGPGVPEPSQPVPVPVPPEGTGPSLVRPEADSSITLWPESGRARPVFGKQGLLSSARVGAGNLIFVHADLSRAPFAAGAELRPTLPGVNLLNDAISCVSQRAQGLPTRALTPRDVLNTVDIAGRRIPGRDFLVVLLLIYVLAAGFGMFLLAKRVRRPELYPAALLVLAVLSVAGVFGVGELYKRSGDRVKAVRLLVCDETTDRNAVFTVGCAYAVDGGDYVFSTGKQTQLMPAELDKSVKSGMPTDYMNCRMVSSASETETTVRELDRWQNVFFLGREPTAIEGVRAKVHAMEGTWQVENLASQAAYGCLVLIGGNPAPGSPAGSPTITRCTWHFVPSLGPSGGSDARATLGPSTSLAAAPSPLATLLGDATADHEQGRAGLLALLELEGRRAKMPNGVLAADAEGKLATMGLLPGDGEFLLIAVLPEDTVSKGSLGPRGVDAEDITQGVLWMVLGAIESR